MVNMILMVVMFAGVLIVSTRKMKKQMAEEQAARLRMIRSTPEWPRKQENPSRR